MLIDHATAGLTVVVDQRYVHPIVSLGWRQALIADGRELRASFEQVILRNPSLHDALSFDWEIDDGADILTALLPQHSAGQWVQELLGTARRGGVRHPVASVVGSGAAAESMRRAWLAIPHLPTEEPRPFPPFMTQARAGGSTTVTVTARDPVDRWGSAATALAAHLVQTQLPLLGSGAFTPETVRMMRHLHEAVPAVSWQIRSAKRRGLLLLESALRELGAQRRSRDPAAIVVAGAEIENEMRDHRRSPVQFARALTRYSAMGWGVELVRDPAAELNGATTEAVDAAYLALLRPLAEVLGQT